MRQRALLTVTAVVAAIWPVIAAQTAVRTQTTAADEGRKRVESFSANGIPRIAALMNLARQHRVPLGVEYAGPELVMPVTLNLTNTDVATVIKALFPTTLGFQVSMRGTVPVIGHRALPPPARNALDVVLARVAIREAMPMQRAASVVWMTLAQQLDPTIGGFAGSELGTPEPRIQPMELRRITVRDALNRLAREDGNAGWFVTVSPGQLDRGWKKGAPAMWSVVQYDYNPPESIRRILESRMPDIVPPGIQVGVVPFNPRKVRHVEPVYPPAAAESRVEGVVIIEIRINEEGRVADARVLRSIPTLDQAALDAVRQWQYEPLLVNGAPTPFVVSVAVNFTPAPVRAR